jgi:hypothetical protein
VENAADEVIGYWDAEVEQIIFDEGESPGLGGVAIDREPTLVEYYSPLKPCQLSPLRLACRKEKPQAGMAELLIRAGAESDVFPPVEKELRIVHEATGKIVDLPPRCIYFWVAALGRHSEATKLRARARIKSHPHACALWFLARLCPGMSLT